MEVVEFIPSLKRLIARRGRPKIIYSDNAKTFKFIAANKWLKTAQKDEKLHHFLVVNKIERRFNLSSAPWWGGQYERLIGLFKRAFYKTIGNGMLTLEELEDVYVCMTLYLHAIFFTDASLINVQLVSMRGVGIIKRTIYKNISNYKTIYKRIGVTLLVHKGNENILVIMD